MPSLAQKLAIAPAWDDWITYEPYDVYIWQNSTHVGIRWYVAAYYDNSIVANFEAILSSDGVIQFNYEYNNGPVSTTIGISNGAGHILAEDLTDLNYINTIVFTPYPLLVAYDVAVTNVTTSMNQSYQGWIVGINVAVANLGNGTETFTVTLYYDSTIIVVMPVQNLGPNTTLTLSFDWNTTNVPFCHSYTIKAVASTVPDETNTENNTFVNGQVKIKIMGDVNGDGSINYLDAIHCGAAFGSTSEDPDWNPQADLTQDGYINYLDVILLGANFGASCP
jgi:hypothetical protein